MAKKRNAKLISSDPVENTEAESRNAKRTAALKAIGDEAALEEAQARADDKPHATLGADEFGMPILPTPEPAVATESEAASVPAEPANGAPGREPSTVPATKGKAVKAKEGEAREKRQAEDGHGYAICELQSSENCEPVQRDGERSQTLQRC